MKKIPTLFVRTHDGAHRITEEYNLECLWVRDGEGVATQKYDGTCCLIRGGQLYKRYDCKKGKNPPPGFEPAMEADPVTGHHTGWVLVGDGPEDEWHRKAFLLLHAEPDGTYELCGPKVQGNPERLGRHHLLPHAEARMFPDCPRDYNGLYEWFKDKDIEGVVWHHPDGRMAKLKKRDFGLSRKPE